MFREIKDKTESLFRDVFYYSRVREGTMPSVSGDGDLFGFHVRRRKHLLLNKLCLQISLLSLWSTGKFCFCGNTLPSPGPVAENLCDVHCIGEPTQRCGGVKHVSVHTASKRVAGLAIASDASGTPIR